MFICLFVAEQHVHRIKHSSATSKKAGVHKNLGRATSGTSDPNKPRDSLYHMILCSAIKAGRKKEEGEEVQSYFVCFPKKLLHEMNPTLLDMVEHLPADCK